MPHDLSISQKAPAARNRALLHIPDAPPPDGSTPFRHGRQMLVPERPGVYLIHDLRGVLYVGRTENLYRRFGQHYWQPDNELLDRAMRRTFGQLTFTWILVKDPARRIQLEAVLIGWLLPLCNRQIG